MVDRASRVWFAAFVLVIFVAGLAAGMAIDRVVGRRGPPPDAPRAFGPFARPLPPPLVERLAADLDLTEAQRQEVHELLERRRSRLRALQGEVAGRFQQEQREFRTELRRILTADQATRLEEALNRPPARRLRELDRRGPPR
jgi:hypothetical protein